MSVVNRVLDGGKLILGTEITPVNDIPDEPRYSGY